MELKGVLGLKQKIWSIWIYGNSFESFLVAVINPNRPALEHWAENNGIAGSFSELCENSRAKEHILSEHSKIANEKGTIGALYKIAK
ncbi:hypothetical protein GUJ93_ZPchr0012g20723 [Zizania palustris]|uniref:Uncharacterized protein n=1 Tax=Zizania palustris TaxID=103762 RepID=A0A8J5WS72_ZIZPA|nr:hypothetical protein GUJ93_ZPchr0012g20723 [Zizania palustris]